MKITFATEIVSALLLMIQFIPDMGVAKGIWVSIFTSVSSFCTAGIDIMQGSFTSLTAYSGNWLVIIVLSIEMFIGGFGFLVIDDLISCRFKWKKLHLHSKIVIIASNAIWICGTLLLFVIEGDFSSEGLANALFQAISGSATGANTIPINEMKHASQMILAFLMFVGGSPGSTAGGIKTTTLVILLVSMLNGATRSPNITIGGKTLKKNAVKQASAVFFLYIFCVFVGSSIILACQNELAIDAVIFESISAIDNVGLSLGITQSFRFGATNMSWLSSLVLSLLMYIGRIGPVTTISLLKSKEDEGILVAPSEDILIG
jgi:trk system potassium uptake protein TrkH